MRACGRAAAHVLRGWPPPRRVCRALLLMTKFELLQRSVGALGAVASICWGAGRLSLDGVRGVPGKRWSGWTHGTVECRGSVGVDRGRPFPGFRLDVR